MKRILVADIGGTNSRFAEFGLDDSWQLRFGSEIWLETNQSLSFSGLLETAAERGFDYRLDFDIAALAVPGPVEDKARVVLPNVKWNIDLADLGPGHRPELVLLLNDFEAQAYAGRTEAVEGSLLVQPGRINHQATLAVIGAGTGLGYCAPVPDRHGGYLAVTSEAGHAGFPFCGQEEYDFADFLLKKTGHDYVYGDLLLSGSGLAALHEFLTGHRLSPSDAAAEMNPESDTTAWFARFYGRACRNYALTVVARGGVYISGGIAARNPFLVMNKIFLDEFASMQVYSDLLRSLPIFLNTNQDSGLWGAAFFGQLNLASGFLE